MQGRLRFGGAAQLAFAEEGAHDCACKLLAAACTILKEFALLEYFAHILGPWGRRVKQLELDEHVDQTHHHAANVLGLQLPTLVLLLIVVPGSRVNRRHERIVRVLDVLAHLRDPYLLGALCFAFFLGVLLGRF